MKNIKFYSDNGHGWAAVKKSELAKYGIEKEISTYSYMRGKTAYLEEDCDVTIYLRKLKENGVQYQLEVKNTDGRSPIRSYDHYTTI